MEYHAFLSYSHADTAIMRRIRTDLANAGLVIWSDESLVPGTASWKNAIEEAIQSSKSLVVLLSPEAKHSDWVEKEVTYAVACGIKIIPILVRGVDEISAVPFELINVQRIDFREDYRVGVQRLITTIQEQGTLSDNTSAMPHAAASHSATIMEELSPMSFYDHVRLFMWIFWQPQKLVFYRNRYDDVKLRRTAGWIVSDLMWIAFLAPAIGIVLGTVHVATDDPIASTAMQAISSFIFIGGWFMTGVLGWRNHTLYGITLFVGTVVVIFSLFFSVHAVTGVILSQAGGLTRPVFLFLISILLSTGAGIAFRLSPSSIGAIVGLLLGSLLFNSITNVTLDLDGGISAFVMFINAILVGWVVDNSLKTGTRTVWHLVSFGVIMVTGALLIVTYFLGGWIILQNL